MSTSVTSVIKHFPSPQDGFTTSLASTISSGAVTVPLNSVAGYTNGDVGVWVVDPTDSTKKQAFTGTVDTAGVQITGVVWTTGTNQTHAGGAAVVDYATATHVAMMTKGLLAAGLLQAGTMTPKITTSINDTNGNEIIKTPATASAVNEITVTNAATGASPIISATGGDATINLNLRGKGLAKTVTIGAGATTIFPYDYVVSGCVWTADAAGSTKLASMTAGVVVINGNPLTVAAVTGRTFTASKDVYVDVLDNGDGTGLLVYTDGTTNAASGALASNSIRLAIIVVGATNIAAAASVNQGQENRVLPIASSIPYAVTDSLGNLICPRDPNRKLLGYRQIISSFATASATAVQMTGMSCPVIVPTGRKIKITMRSPNSSNSTAAYSNSVIYDGVIGGAGTLVALSRDWSAVAVRGPGSTVTAVVTPSAASKTYNGGLAAEGGGTATYLADDTVSYGPAFIMVELV